MRDWVKAIIIIVVVLIIFYAAYYLFIFGLISRIFGGLTDVQQAAAARMAAYQSASTNEGMHARMGGASAIMRPACGAPPCGSECIPLGQKMWTTAYTGNGMPAEEPHSGREQSLRRLGHYQ